MLFRSCVYIVSSSAPYFFLLFFLFTLLSTSLLPFPPPHILFFLFSFHLFLLLHSFFFFLLFFVFNLFVEKLGHLSYSVLPSLNVVDFGPVGLFNMTPLLLCIWCELVVWSRGLIRFRFFVFVFGKNISQGNIFFHQEACNVWLCLDIAAFNIRIPRWW